MKPLIYDMQSIVFIFALQLADDADKYLPLEEDTKSNGVTNPVNEAVNELEEFKESPSRSQQHVQTSV